MNAIYKIIGDDGKEYGPATAEQIRQWTADGRVERRTPIFVDGAKDWNFVGLLPEFAGLFSSAAPPAIAPVGQPRRTNGFATAGFVCGILSLTLCLCCGGIPCNIFGLIFSIVGLVQIGGRPESSAGRGLAIAGLVLSAASFLIFLVMLLSGNTHFYFNNGQFQ